MNELTKMGNEELFKTIIDCPSNDVSYHALFKEYMLRLSRFDRPAECHVVYFNKYKLIPWCVLHQQKAKDFDRCTND